MAGFFSEKEKIIGEKVPSLLLDFRYKKSEAKLNKAARNGDVSALEREMQNHHEYEYARLYQKVLASQKKRAKPQKSKSKFNSRKGR